MFNNEDITRDAESRLEKRTRQRDRNLKELGLLRTDKFKWNILEDASRLAERADERFEIREGDSCEERYALKTHGLGEFAE